MAQNCSSKPQWAHLEYCWKLENFWELRALASIEALEEEGGGVIWSPRFGDAKRGLWRLKVYPYGDTSAAGKGHVSVFLALDTKTAATSKTYAIFGCYVLDAQENKKGSASWGWSQFIKADDHSLTSMLVNDTLTFKCDIDIFIGVKNTSTRNEQQSMKLSDELVEFFSYDTIKDARLKIGNTEIPINTILLCARSLTFRALIIPSTMPNHLGKDFQPEVVSRRELKGSANEAERKLKENLISAAAEKRDAVHNKASPERCLAPLFSNPREFVTLSIIESSNDETEEGTEDALSTRTIVLELTHSEVTPYAVQQMVHFILNDVCEIFLDISPPIVSILEVLIVSCVYNVQSLRNACIELLLGRVTAKSDAILILAVAEKFQCDALIHTCRMFLQYFTPELQGAELIRLLLPSSATPSCSSLSPSS